MSTRPTVDESHNPWSVQSSEVRYENPWISVRHDEVTDPSGRSGVYGVISPKSFALGVLPVFHDGTVLLVGQYRYPLSRYSWEMPEGGGSKDVDPLVSVARELREETGHEALSWLHVMDITLSNSVTDEWAMCWAAWDLRPVTAGAEPESTEDLTVWRAPYRAVVDLVWSGEIFDSMTVATVAKVEAMRLRNELPVVLTELLSG
jgi:8-oxo-dGTP pyrophosphatase MutT (NUDIX family)